MTDDDVRPDPPEHDIGQDDEPPDLGLALLVCIALLTDLRDHLDPEADDGDGADLLVRIGAVLILLHRVRTRLEQEADRGSVEP